MTTWLMGNIVLLAMVLLWGRWGSRNASAEAEHVNGLIFFAGVCGWTGWVVLGSLAFLIWPAR
jgi:hypothetical protein